MDVNFHTYLLSHICVDALNPTHFHYNVPIVSFVNQIPRIFQMFHNIQIGVAFLDHTT